MQFRMSERCRRPTRPHARGPYLQLPHDYRFHVDNLSSAHVYLRLPEGGSMEDIPEETMTDCAQLVKQNSIMGGWEADSCWWLTCRHSHESAAGGAAPL
jgi:hypothetical protein